MIVRQVGEGCALHFASVAVVRVFPSKARAEQLWTTISYILHRFWQQEHAHSPSPDLTKGFYPAEANFKSHQAPGQFFTPYLAKIQPWISECALLFRIPSSRFWATWCWWRLLMTVTHQHFIEVSFPFFLRTFKTKTTVLLFVRYASPKQCWSKLRNGAEPDRAGSFDLFFLFYMQKGKRTQECPVSHVVLCCWIVPLSGQWQIYKVFMKKIKMACLTKLSET